MIMNLTFHVHCRKISNNQDLRGGVFPVDEMTDKTYTSTMDSSFKNREILLLLMTVWMVLMNVFLSDMLLTRGHIQQGAFYMGHLRQFKI